MFGRIVIRRARELIGYDGYGTVEQWLDVADENENESENENKNNTNENKHGNNTSKSPDHHHGPSRPGHPAGELEDYDPDRPLFSQKTIVDVLEAAAAEMEAGRDDASPASSCYRYLTSDSLGGEPLLDNQYQFQGLDVNPPSAIIDEKSSTPSPPLSTSNSNSNSELLTVPLPAHTAPARARAGKYTPPPHPHPDPHPHPLPQPTPDTQSQSQSNNYFFAQPYLHLEIERGASPMPRFRGQAPYPVSPDSEVPPTLQRRRQLLATRPGPGPSFVARRRVGGRVPLLIDDEDGGGMGMWGS
ncbi:hypothetical protein F4859DRAFT_512993 [Xylaria cf. heliscus]|nr:hypothetical protein F4859DRAFT_512993 [Xylaria cf. heliscus]